MKIEQLLVQHFYNAGEVTLQGMGTFTLSPDFVMPKESDKDLEMPSNAISFQYNTRAVADEALINYVVEQTRKMRALAAADLDSYLVLGRQFLNIGKPFKIEGMGFLSKNQQGGYDFFQGHSFHSKLQGTPPAALREKRVDSDISFATEAAATGNSKKILIVLSTVIGLGLLSATAWYFLIRKNNNIEPVAAKTEVKTDTSKAVVNTDTVSVKKVAAVAANDYTFKVVFLVTPDSAKAAARMNALTTRNHKVIMYKADSLRYKLAEPFTLPLTDTTHIKDSLNSFYYAGKAFIELQ